MYAATGGAPFFENVSREGLRAVCKLFAGLAAAVAVSCAATAGPQIKFTNVNAWGGSSSGGPFEVEATGFTPVGLGLRGATPGRFITFCVERNEYIKEGHPATSRLTTPQSPVARADRVRTRSIRELHSSTRCS